MKHLFLTFICVLTALQAKCAIAEGDGWSLSADSVLTVGKNFEGTDNYPWDDNREQIKKVVIQNGVTSIGKKAFDSCRSLTSVAIPEGVTSIGEWAFAGCHSLTGITIPEGVTSIGKWAFLYCEALASVSIPSSLSSIGDDTFSSCNSLASVTIPEGVTTIGEGAFSFCKALASVSIPNSVTSIGNNAFIECSSLTSITIPSGVTYIGEDVFADCTNLTSITSHIAGENLCQTELGVGSITIYIPEGSTDAYESAWGASKIYVEMSPEKPTHVADATGEEPVLEKVYDLSGRPLGNRTDGLRKGMYVFVYSDGTSQKAFVK